MDANYIFFHLAWRGGPVGPRPPAAGASPPPSFCRDLGWRTPQPGACAHRDAATRGSQPVLGSGLGRWLSAVKPPSVLTPCLGRVRGGRRRGPGHGRAQERGRLRVGAWFWSPTPSYNYYQRMWARNLGPALRRSLGSSSRRTTSAARLTRSSRDTDLGGPGRAWPVSLGKHPGRCPGEGRREGPGRRRTWAGEERRFPWHGRAVDRTHGVCRPSAVRPGGVGKRRPRAGREGGSPDPAPARSGRGTDSLRLPTWMALGR